MRIFWTLSHEDDKMMTELIFHEGTRLVIYKAYWENGELYKFLWRKPGWRFTAGIFSDLDVTFRFNFPI